MVYVHLAEGFEEVEALTVVDVLKRADIDVNTVSVSGEGIVTGAHGIKVCADMLFEEADYDKCDMIVLPGGLPGAENLKNHEGLNEKIDEFIQQNKTLAAICAAPMVLGTHALLSGKTATIYPGMEEQLGNLIPLGAEIVQDVNVITGKGPAFAMKFALVLVENIKGANIARKVAEGLLYDAES